ncbi:MAG: transglutaminase domain-containing protein [Anaerotignum sp.]|nr:transglutaminase domain-containing protein [Anaerotignum sp.]
MKKRYKVFSVLFILAALGTADCFYQINSNEEGTIKSNTAEQNAETKVDLEKFEYVFQPHVISKEYLAVYGADIERIFYDFSDAVWNGEDTFPCPSIEKFREVLSVSVNCLPIAAQYVDKDKICVENGIGYIAYTIEKTELLSRIAAFREKVTHVITSAVPYREEPFVMAIELLTAVAHKNQYDEESLSLEHALKWKPYRAIMEDKGICQEFAGEYIYYLLQVGINATTCSALSRDKETAHTWVLLELDHEWYHADPTFTLAYKDSLAFFGLNDVMREQYGDFPAANFSFAESDLIRYEADSKRFMPLWNAESYEIDRENKRIVLKSFYSGEEKEYWYGAEEKTAASSMIE